MSTPTQSRNNVYLEENQLSPTEYPIQEFHEHRRLSNSEPEVTEPLETSMSDCIVYDQVQNHVHQGVSYEFKAQCDEIYREVSTPTLDRNLQIQSSPRNDLLKWGYRRKTFRHHAVRNREEKAFQNVNLTTLLNENHHTVSRNLRNDYRIPEIIFPWKHYYPSKWKNLLENFFLKFLCKFQFCIFNSHVIEGEKWCYFNLMGTEEQLTRAKEELEFFILTSMPKESKTIYISIELPGNTPSWVSWEHFPYPSSIQGRNPSQPTYILISADESSHPFLNSKILKPYSHINFLKSSSLLFQNVENVFSKNSFLKVIHELLIYHRYFKDYYPFSTKCKFICAFGKQVVTQNQIRPPNTPNQPFPLNEIEKRHKVCNITPEFNLALWHKKEEIFRILMEAGFELKKSSNLIFMDIPALEGIDCVARAKWVKHGECYALKNFKLANPEPIKLILNFTGLIYDFCLKAVYKISKMVEDIPGLTFPKSNPFSPNFSSLKQGKPASKNTELYGCFTENWVFKHSKLPIEAKLIHCCPNNRKAYLTLHFSLTLELDSVVKVEYWQLILCTFLDAICSVASAFPSTSVL